MNYILFVTFFPHLLAGPIIHHSEMMPQFNLNNNKVINYNNIYTGCILFTIGLFKKTVIANHFAFSVDPYFNQVLNFHTINFWDSWLASLAYSIQLYYDFSGYTDMAIGIALIFNIILPINFNSPYKAQNIQDFWRRWHITLGRFMREYVFIPLGGNKLGKFRTDVNIFFVFLLGGIWHGAGWTYIVWGTLHGLAFMFTKFWRSYFKFKIYLPISILLTFLFSNFARVFFRAPDLKVGLIIVSAMLDIKNYGEFNYKLVPVIIMVIFSMILPNSNQITQYIANKSSLYYPCILAILLCLGLAAINLIPNTPFIYFQF